VDPSNAVNFWFHGVLEAVLVVVLVVHHVDLGAAATFAGKMTHASAFEARSFGWSGALVVLAGLCGVASELVAESSVYWCTGSG
jgi:hypothetical protein